MAERVSLIIVRFFIGVWVIRYLGPKDWGIYSYGISLAGIFVPVSKLGLDNIIVRRLSKKEYSDEEILGTSLLLRVTVSLVTIVFFSAIIYYRNVNYVSKIVTIAIIVHILFRSSNVADLWFQSEINSKNAVLARVSVNILYAVFQVLFILCGLSVVYFAYLYVSWWLLRTLGTSVAYIHTKGELERWTLNIAVGMTMLSESIPMIIASLSVAAYMKIDQVIIGELINSSAVGVYSSAVKMSEVFYFIPTAFATSLYPKIVEKRESADRKSYDEFKKKIYEYFTLMAWLVTVPISIFAPFIVELLFGQEYIDASSVLSIHIWAFMFVCIGVVRSRQMIAEDKYKLIAVSNFIGAISNIVLSVLLVYAYGIEGAAIATVLSYATSVWISNYLFAELNDLFYLISSSIVAPIVKIPKYLRAVFSS